MSVLKAHRSESKAEYVGQLNYDEETGYFYDEDGDVVDLDTVAGFCAGDGKGDDEED